MEKRDKPGLFSGVILPVVLLEVLVIIFSLLSAVFYDSLGFGAFAVVLFLGIVFLIGFFVLCLVYVLKYNAYEEGFLNGCSFNVLSLVGFIMVAGSYVFGTFLGVIPLLGIFFSFFFMLVIVAGGVISFIAVYSIKEGERGRGFANLGAFLSVYYLVHLILSIVLVVVLWAVVSSFLKPI